MNRLLNRAPTSVIIGGKEYEINTSFRDCLYTIDVLQNNEFEAEEKAEILINNMYEEDPDNIQEALEQAIWFLKCGETERKSKGPELCNFKQDGTYIYNAFLKANVNLDIEDMHWWTFMSRFSELPESLFTRIVYLRSQQSRGKLTKEEKQECDRIGMEVINVHHETTRDTEFEKLL